jgi:hypothetical protein
MDDFSDYSLAHSRMAASPPAYDPIFISPIWKTSVLVNVAYSDGTSETPE